MQVGCHLDGIHEAGMVEVYELIGYDMGEKREHASERTSQARSPFQGRRKTGTRKGPGRPHGARPPPTRATARVAPTIYEGAWQAVSCMVGVALAATLVVGVRSPWWGAVALMWCGRPRTAPTIKIYILLSRCFMGLSRIYWRV